MPVLNLVVAVLRDRPLLLSLLVERFVLTLINEDYYYYYSHSPSFPGFPSPKCSCVCVRRDDRCKLPGGVLGGAAAANALWHTKL